MKIALIQITSVLDYKINLEKIQNLLQKAKGEGAKIAFLPECFYSMSDGKKPTPYLIEDNNEHYNNIKKLAVDSGLYIVGGSAATLVDGKIINRAFNFSPVGEDIGHYDKRKLFSCDIIKEGIRKKVDEGDIYTPGNDGKIIEVEGWKIGLGICFDVRFSAFADQYRKNDVDILTYASAFTVPTGMAHWHLLNRARAVENQCYVVSSAQTGQNSEVVSTYGHSLIVDPWGDILADCGEGEGMSVVELFKERKDQVRKQVIMTF